MDFTGYIIIGFLVYFLIRGILLKPTAEPDDKQKREQLLYYASLEPVLGLLGTVMGLVVAFFRLRGEKGGPSALLEKLGGGVYTAILTTVIGLIFSVILLYRHRRIERQGGGR